MANRVVRILIPLVAALGVTAVAYVVIPQPSPAPAHRRQVAMGVRVIADQNIQQGALLSARMVSLQSVPRTMITPADLTNLSQAVGQVTQVELTAGEAIRNEDMEPQASAGIEYQVSPGKRAMTIAVSDTGGVDYRLLPDERVDVLVTTQVGATARSGIVLSDLRVLALGPPAPGTGQTSRTTGSNTTNYNTVTLGVTPVQAATLAQAEAKGTITLLLRRVGPNGRARLEYPGSGPKG